MTDTKPKIAAIVAGAVSTAATLALLAGLIPRLGTGSQKLTVKISVPDIGQKYDQAVAAQAAMLRENQPAVQAKKLNDGDLIAPVPNPNGYGQVMKISDLDWFAEKAAPLLEGQKLYFGPEREQLPGSVVNFYLDDSIATVTWKEPYGTTVLTFAEVVIADGSQFRRFLADGRYPVYHHGNGADRQCGAGFLRRLL